MERSQSFTNFSVLNENSCNLDNNNNKSCNRNSNNNIASTAITNKLRKARDLRQTQQMQQPLQQQQQQQQRQLSGSSDNISAIYNSSTPTTTVLFQSLRQKTLKRQARTEDVEDENDYAADLEDEDDEEHLNNYSHCHQLDSQTQLYQSQLSQRSTTPININPTCHSPTPSCPSTERRCLKHDDSFDSIGSPQSLRRIFNPLLRDNSMQSDSSHYSSVDSLLESRKPDPEAILINLGFGPPAGAEDILTRIPKRFLKPSQVRGINTDEFVRRLQLASSLADHSVLGYRGLIGNPDLPPSTIVAKIMERFEVIERKKSLGGLEHSIR